jgi:hypothetical protein
MNERPPTEKENLELKQGYKVLVKSDRRLTAPFNNFIYSHKWKYAYISLEPYYANDCGFHVFMRWEDATIYKRLIKNAILPYADKDDELVVRKVDIKEIIAIGEISKGYYGCGEFGHDSVLRCSQIRLSKEEV